MEAAKSKNPSWTEIHTCTMSLLAAKVSSFGATLSRTNVRRPVCEEKSQSWLPGTTTNSTLAEGWLLRICFRSSCRKSKAIRYSDAAPEKATSPEMTITHAFRSGSSARSDAAMASERSQIGFEFSITCMSLKCNSAICMWHYPNCAFCPNLSDSLDSTHKSRVSSRLLSRHDTCYARELP